MTLEADFLSPIRYLNGRSHKRGILSILNPVNGCGFVSATGDHLHSGAEMVGEWHSLRWFPVLYEDLHKGFHSFCLWCLRFLSFPVFYFETL